MKQENKKAFAGHRVTLQDSNPSTEEAKESLKENLVKFLEIDSSEVQELINSMPVILKSGVSKEEAISFAQVLRELGALVFVEKEIEEKKTIEKKNETSSKHEKNLKNPLFLGMGALILSLLAAVFFLTGTKKQSSFNIDSESIAKMIVDIKDKRIKKKEEKNKAKEVIWYGKKYLSPVAISIEVLERNDQPVIASIKFATESPGELSPQELIRGLKSVWLKEGDAIFKDLENLEKKKSILETEAKIYFLKQEANERFVTKATLEKIEPDEEMSPKEKKKHRLYKFSIEHHPKPQFLGEPFFLEYGEEKGYSVVLNQEIELEKKEDKEDTNIAKILEEGIQSELRGKKAVEK